MAKEIEQASVNVLKVHPRNTEFFDDISGEEYDRFKNSIKNDGILSPIIISSDMTIISGHQRVKAAKELGVNIDTLYGCNKRAKDARLDLGPGTQTPDTAMSLTEEVQKLRQQNREQTREIARLKEENEFLAEASAFFAASRQKSAKT